MVREHGASTVCRPTGGPGGTPPLGAESLRNAHDGAGLPAPVALGWEAGHVFSPGAVAHSQLVRLARDSVSPGQTVAQWGIVFDASGALQVVRDVAAALENLPGLHPAMGHVSLLHGDWRVPAILQQGAAHLAIYQVSGGRAIQVYSCGTGIIHSPSAEGSVTWVPQSTYSRGRVVLKAASGSSMSYVAANIDATALGRYLRRSPVLELPAKARQAILRRLETTAGPKGRGTPDPAHSSVPDPPWGGEDFRAVSLNLRRGLVGKVQALGPCLRGWGYADRVGLQEVGKLPAHMVAHAMYWVTFTQVAHPAAGVGILMCWPPTFLEVGRDTFSSGRGLALEYRSRGGRILAVVVCFPADQDVDMVRTLLAWVLSVMAPRRGVYTLLGNLNTNPGWATGFRMAPAALGILWEDFLRDTGLSRCTPAVEVPTWTDGRGCVGVIGHILQGTIPKEGGLWVDEASPFPSDHRPVVWDARGVLDPETRLHVLLRARRFQVYHQGIAGAYHAAHREQGARPGDLASLYSYFLASTIQALEAAHSPPREFRELLGRVNQVHRQLQAHARKWPRW